MSVCNGRMSFKDKVAHMKKISLLLLCGLSSCVAGCDDGNQSSPFPDQPFKLPDGSTAYPPGSIVTPIDTKEDREKGHLIVWPDKLLNWFYRTPEIEDVSANLIPISKLLVSEESYFVVNRLSQSALNDDPLIVLEVIEPNANASEGGLEQMTVKYMGRDASIRSVHGPFAAPQEVLDGILADNPKWNNLARWIVIVDIDQYEIEGQELSIDLEIKYIDQSSKKIQDKITGTIRARAFIPREWSPKDVIE